MSVFVERKAGIIVGVFARPQVEDQEELLATSPEVVAFINPLRPTSEERDVSSNMDIIETIAEVTGTPISQVEATYVAKRAARQSR